MKRKLIKKIIRTGGAIIFACAIAIVASVFGEHEADAVKAAKALELEDVPVAIKSPIAIVNLDEGLVQNDKKVNYGTDLIKSISEDIRVTGLGDARQGIDNGEYSAYIIVPANFSERVATINEQPTKSILTYALSKEMDLTEREKVLGGVVNIYNTFSNALSKVYLSSLIKEYHGVQDAANGIMDRDKLDMEKLLAVNGYDLVELIEIPEMETVDKDVSALDLSEQYTKNNNTLAAIDSSYETSLANGESDYKAILDTLKDVEDYEEATTQKINDTKKDINDTTKNINDNSLTETDVAKQKKTEEDEYNQRKAAITKTLGVLGAHDEDLLKFNQSVLEQSAKYDATEDYYRAFIDQFEGDFVIDMVENVPNEIDVKGTPVSMDTKIVSYHVLSEADFDAYRSLIKQEYVSRLMQMIDNAANNLQVNSTEEPAESEEGDTEETGEPVEDPATAKMIMAQNILGENLTYDEASYEWYVEEYILANCERAESLLLTATIPQGDIEAPHLDKGGNTYYEVPQVDADTMTTAVTGELDKLVVKAKEGADKRNSAYTTLFTGYQNGVNTINQKVADIETAYGDEGTLQTQSNKELSAFNIASYIDDATLTQHKENLENNNEDISQKVNDNSEKYEAYATDVYDATSNNVEALKQNISDGQEKSKQKLEEGLAEAKESRETSNQSNSDNLKTFSSRLAYTRLGELENKEVYDFIAEPILLDNQSQLDGLEKKQAKKAPEEPQKDVPQGATKGPMATPMSVVASVIPKWAWFAVGFGVLLMVSLFTIVKILAHKRKEEF